MDVVFNLDNGGNIILRLQFLLSDEDHKQVQEMVKYTFSEGKIVLMMPPTYSSDVQESKMGSWHVPKEETSGDERLRIWLCIDRTGPCKQPHEAPAANRVAQDVSPSVASNVSEQRREEDNGGFITGRILIGLMQRVYDGLLSLCAYSSAISAAR
ncbi:hypothetical protein E2562_007796, partial [Oryza meyeriana var. granulata]